MFCEFKLYCCNDYQEYVDGLLKYQSEKEKILKDDSGIPKNSQRKLNPKAKKLAKERDEQR